MTSTVDAGTEFDVRLAKTLDYFAEAQFPGRRALYKLYWSFALWHLRGSIIGRLKRLLDICLAVSALIFLSPLMAITAVAIRLESPGPAIFKQTRVGKWGKRFTCYKFRSMCDDAEAQKNSLLDQNDVHGPLFKMQKDPRVTRFGRIIRKLSIDELPQLVNVLKGEMSIVGPRPSLPLEVEYYDLRGLRRLEAIPGLTGLPQISGRSDLEFERWLELDLKYIAKQNIKQDILIMLKTIPVVLFGRGAY